MQIVSIAENVKARFLEKTKQNILHMSSAKTFTQSAER